MQLQEWLSNNDFSHETVAKFLHCSVYAIRKWVSGEREPRGHMREKIRKMTKDMVMPNDWQENSRAYEVAVVERRRKRKRKAAA